MEIGSICPSEICFSLPESCTAQLSETPGRKQGLKGERCAPNETLLPSGGVGIPVQEGEQQGAQG